MCTILLEPETLQAEKLSREDSQKAVDQLMTYDRLLSEPFTREELKELFTPMESICIKTMIKGNYKLLTDEEKEIVEELGLTPKPGEMISRMSSDSTESQSVEDRRRALKSGLIDYPDFIGGWRKSWYSGHTGHIFVWLDNMNFCSTKKGFYYVRYQNSMLWNGTTAYAHPVLIVQKSKLRADQVEYMERKCRETMGEK